MTSNCNIILVIVGLSALAFVLGIFAAWMDERQRRREVEREYPK
jgi:uncharacterized membrane protein YuzA (DUF378 family)